MPEPCAPTFPSPRPSPVADREGILYEELDLRSWIDDAAAIQARANDFDEAEARWRRGLLLRRAQDPDVRAVGALRDGELLGYTYGAPFDTTWSWGPRLLAELDRAEEARTLLPLGRPFVVLELHVDPSAWRLGIGSGLVRRLCGGAREPWVLLTRRRAADQARLFYRSLGFRDLTCTERADGYVAMGVRGNLRGLDVHR
ncbi:GNAT family N-acetyltransferase [Streptomyces sp. NPDC059918]|uniref:GNAT family N-acetyltransferase n=1 Tax=unclassified Streptomyces TaxID=2593676 RepID=UPI003666FC42